MRQRKHRWPDLAEMFMLLGSRFAFNAASCLFPQVRRYRQAGRNSVLFLDAVRKVANAPVLIDSSKNVPRGKLLMLVDPERMRWIHLVRDGRAVANSYLRHKIFGTMEQAATAWKRRNRYIEAMQLTIPREQRMLIRYEDLCREPEAQIRRVCDFVGVEFAAEMLQFRESPKHNISGNPMRFRGNDRTIKLDERWRETLSKDDLAVFAGIGERMNVKYGYSE